MVSPIVTNTDTSLEGKRLITSDDYIIRINVKSFPYLATGDGTTDDTAAIRSAITALPATNGVLFFPAGTYIVDLNEPGLSNTQLGAILPFTTTNTKIDGEGAASIIKVKNNASRYTTIIGGANFSSTDLTGLEVCNLVFDHNIDNNNINNHTTINFQHTIRVGIGNNIKVRKCEIKNSSSVNNVTINGVIENAWIENCYFHDNGDDPSHVQHDVSVIYTNAEKVIIRNNIIKSTGKDDGGATTGIETHGSYTLVEGNIVIDYRTGMNITGVFEDDTRNVIVSGNVVKGANLGINIWSQEYLTHTAGYGFDGLLVDSNIIELASVADWPIKNAVGFLMGIGLNPGTPMMDSNDITISNNVINHPFEIADVGSNTGSHGIGWVSSTNKTLSRLKVYGNRISNFPMAGIRFSCNLLAADISGNDLSNCGNTLDTARAGTLAFRFPMMIAPPNCHGLKVSNNYFYDDLSEAVFRPAYFIALTQSVTVDADGVEFTDNMFTSLGSAMSGTYQIDNSGALLQPYVRGVIRNFTATPFGSANQKFALGSQIVDPVDGSIWTIASNQITWTEGLLSSAPVSIARFTVSGSILVNGDFTVHANWGASPTLVVAGTDSGFVAHITAGAAGTGANPSLILTFTDGAWPTAPIAIGQLANSNHAAMMDVSHFFTCNTTTLTITLNGTPNASGTYEFHVLVIGK